jgi:hypothetical protein
MSDQDIERELEAITEASEAVVLKKTAGVEFAYFVDSGITVCVLTLDNGISVVGSSTAGEDFAKSAAVKEAEGLMRNYTASATETNDRN